MRITPRDINRLHEKIDRSGTTPDACRPWTGSVVRGLGRFRLGRKLVNPQRVVAALVYGRAPRNVGATCGNRLCCRADHIEDARLIRATKSNGGRAPRKGAG